MNFEDELKQRMALAKQQGWGDDEIQRSAMIERATNYNRQFQQQAQAQQQQPNGAATGLKGFALDLTPFGRVAEKLINPNAGKVTAGEVGTEAALTLLPFGIGKLAKGFKLAKGVVTGVKAAEDASKASKSTTILRNMSRKSTIAPTSTLQTATEQNRLIDLARNTPALRGSAANKFQQAPGVINQLSDNVDQLFKGVDEKLPVKQFNKGVSQVRNDIVDDNERKRFDIELQRVVGKTFDGQLPQNMSATDLNSLRRGVNAQMSGIYKKVNAGTTLTDKDNAMLQLKNHLDSQLEKIAPDNIRAQVRQNNLDMNTLIKGTPEFKKAAETGGSMGPLGNLFGVGPMVNRTIQGTADRAGRVMATKTAQKTAQQAGVRLGAETLGLRNHFKPATPEDPNNMPALFANPQSPDEAILNSMTGQGAPTDFQTMADAFDKTKSSYDAMGNSSQGSAGDGQSGPLQYSSSQFANAAMKAFMSGDSQSYKQLSDAAAFAAQMEKQQASMGGGGGPSNVGKVTAQQYGLAQSGAQALQQLTGLLQSDPSVLSRTATPGRNLPIVGGVISNAAGTGQFDAIGYNIADSILRLRTGATANASEVRNLQAQIMPRAGDSAQTVQTKLQQIQQMFGNVLQLAGGGGGSGGSSDPQDELAALFGGDQSQYAYGY